MLRTEWELDSNDQAALEEEFGSGCLVSGKPVVLTKHYEQDCAYWSVPLDEPRVLQHLITQVGLNATERRALEKYATAKELHAYLASAAAESPAKAALLKRIATYRNQDAFLKAIDILGSKQPKFVYFSSYSRMEGDVSIEAVQSKRSNGQLLTEGEQVFLSFLEYADTTLDELAAVRCYEDLNARCEAASNRITDRRSPA